MLRSVRIVGYILPALSFVVLAAHFYRDGLWPLSVACVALAAMLAWHRAWVATLLQVALAAGALEWAWTTFVLVQQRMAQGRPWGRLAVILGIVTLVTAASVVAVGFLRRKWRPEHESNVRPAP